MTHCLLVSNHPCAQAQLINADVIDIGTCCRANLQNRNNKRLHIVIRDKALDDSDLALWLGINDQAWVHHNSVGFDVMDDFNHSINGNAFRNAQRNRLGIRSIEFCKHIRRAIHRDAGE